MAIFWPKMLKRYVWVNPYVPLVSIQVLDISSLRSELVRFSQFQKILSVELLLLICCGFWTKRISNTEAKVYIKNPEYGKKYRILHQTAGSGSYDSILAHTPLSSAVPKLRFAIGSYYFVRTFDLEPGTNRIRISVDGEDVELRGLNRPVRYDR